MPRPFPIVDGKKKCWHCRTEKSLEYFRPSTKNSTGTTGSCIQCLHKMDSDSRKRNAPKIRQTKKEWHDRIKNKEEMKDKKADYSLRRLYGFSLAEKKLLLEHQLGKCAMPGCNQAIELRSSHLDHDHKKDGVVRGLLCMRCNLKLGVFEENVDFSSSCSSYLENNPGTVFYGLKWLRLAYESATLSPDPSTQTGAVLVGAGNSFVIPSYNYFPSGVTPYTERAKKMARIEHAERNAIFAAAREGLKTERATLYAPWFACADCSRAIIQAGITTVIGHKEIWEKTPERWRESTDVGLEMLREAGVKIKYISSHFGITVKFNGEFWTA